MLSSVLRSEQVIEVNIAIMRAFSKLRRIPLENRELAVKLNNLERKYDKQFRVVFDAIRELMKPDLQNGLNLQTYLENVFERLPHCETLEDYQELLPWTWRQ